MLDTRKDAARLTFGRILIESIQLTSIDEINVTVSIITDMGTVRWDYNRYLMRLRL